MTGHIWDCFGLLANRRAMTRLPLNVQEIVRAEIHQAVMDQRADAAKLDTSLKAVLQSKGMTIVDADRPAFRAALQKSTFYTDWRVKFGDQAWAALQSVSGPLV
jgi:TRAP-type C4-dicarboxylate transport system substrate-binding protein